MRRVTSGPNPLAGYSKTYLVFFAIVAIMSITGAAMAAAPQDGGSQMVMAEFKNVGPITSQAVVRIGGTDVGTTGKPEVDPDRKIAVMPLDLEPRRSRSTRTPTPGSTSSRSSVRSTST